MAANPEYVLHIVRGERSTARSCPGFSKASGRST